LDFSRTALLDALDCAGPRLEALEAKAEAAAEPTREAVEILHDLGLVGLKSPRAVGGAEADWTLQIEVLERVAWYNLSAAWCLMLYFDNTGRALSSLPEAGVSRLLSGGRIPAVCGGGGLRMGQLTPAPEGWRLSGNWIFGSGLPQADYVNMSALTPDGVMRQCIVPIADVVSADNWQVMGLKGTGSVDFSVNDAFLPSELSFAAGDPPLRGGHLYRLGVFGYAGLCMPAVMVGAARRALHDLAKAAATKSRGYTKKTTLADRGVFRAFVGESDLKLKAARLLTIATGERLLADVASSGAMSEANEAEARAVGVYCSQTAIAVMNGIIGYAGGEAVRAGRRFERTLRDLHMAGTHMFVSDIGYENHAEFVMGLADAKLSA
jgi:indole-3-acetate monooxygenase